MTFDEPSGGHTSARSSETVTRRDIIGELTDKFDQLLEVCQSNLLEIQKLKAGAATVDSVFKPTVNSTPVQQRENGCGNVTDGCYAAMQNNPAKCLSDFDISELGKSIGEHIKRIMEKPLKAFEDACLMIKAQCQCASKARNYPPRTFVRPFEGNSNSPRAKLCYFHFKFGEESFKCGRETCSMIDHPNVKFVQTQQVNNRRVSNQENAKLCYFHLKFGNEAFKCEGGTCTMINHPTIKFVQEKQPFDNRRVNGNYLTSLEEKMKELREEKELAVAEAKHMQHQTIEAKDNEVAELRTIIANLNNEMKELKQKNEEQLSKMELELKSAVEKTASLEKERIKLQEGNKKMTEEVEHKIEETEKKKEKERGKAQVLRLVQQQSQKKLEIADKKKTDALQRVLRMKEKLGIAHVKTDPLEDELLGIRLLEEDKLKEKRTKENEDIKLTNVRFWCDCD